jgi:hypothetical protein
MKKVAFILLAMLAFLASCKKEDPIPNPLYGEWRLTNWIFEGRDITDSIEVIWGEDHAFFFGEKYVKLGSTSGISLRSNNATNAYAGDYRITTSDLNYIDFSLKNRNYAIVDSVISARYALAGIDDSRLVAELFFKSDNEFLMYVIVGGSQLNFMKL